MPIPSSGMQTLAFGVVDVNGALGASAVMIDDVRVAAVPEPGSVVRASQADSFCAGCSPGGMQDPLCPEECSALPAGGVRGKRKRRQKHTPKIAESQTRPFQPSLLPGFFTGSSCTVTPCALASPGAVCAGGHEGPPRAGPAHRRGAISSAASFELITG